jgi:hypothetical protein
MKAENLSRRCVLQATLAALLGGLLGVPRQAKARPEPSVRPASYDVGGEPLRPPDTYWYDAAGRCIAVQHGPPESVLREPS